MRSKEEIQKQISTRGNSEADRQLALELLLDIRELLAGIKFKLP